MPEEKPELRNKVIDELYDKLDEVIAGMYEEYKVNYGEIEVAILRMNEKILQQKITLMHMYLHDEKKTEDTSEEKNSPDGMYK